MNLICSKCGEILLGGAEHATPEACLASAKELLKRVRKTLSVSAADIAGCRAKKHNGKKVLYPLNVCQRCLASGFAGYQIAHEVISTGGVPRVQIPVKPQEGAKP